MRATHWPRPWRSPSSLSIRPSSLSIRPSSLSIRPFISVLRSLTAVTKSPRPARFLVHRNVLAPTNPPRIRATSDQCYASHSMHFSIGSHQCDCQPRTGCDRQSALAQPRCLVSGSSWISGPDAVPGLYRLKPKLTVGGGTERAEVTRFWHFLPPWPDAVPGLYRLKSRFIVAAVSNGNVALITDVARHAGLPWDCILGAELARHYKPDPECYLTAVELLGLEPGQALTVAAHPDDLRAAGRGGPADGVHAAAGGAWRHRRTTTARGCLGPGGGGFRRPRCPAGKLNGSHGPGAGGRPGRQHAVPAGQGTQA